jgi:hypothetical protein
MSTKNLDLCDLKLVGIVGLELNFKDDIPCSWQTLTESGV